MAPVRAYIYFIRCCTAVPSILLKAAFAIIRCAGKALSRIIATLIGEGPIFLELCLSS